MMVYLKTTSKDQKYNIQEEQIQRSILKDEIMMLLDEITLKTIDHLETSHRHQMVFDVFKSLFDIELFLVNEIETKHAMIPQSIFAAKTLQNELAELYELHSYYNAFRIIILCRIDTLLVSLYEQAASYAKYNVVEALKLYNTTNRIFDFYYYKFKTELVRPELTAINHYHYMRMLNECLRIFDSIHNAAEKMKGTTKELFSIIN